jgi:predicted DNA-binding transcriptional regulator YafY
VKLDRLLGILTVLLKNEIITAPKLANQFEVSRRTICRDIEDLCMAGIPVVTIQGSGGGIRIADGYKIDKTLFTTKEMQTILAGLKSLDSVDGTSGYQTLVDKIYPGNTKDINNVYDVSGSIVIDLASYYKGSLTPKIELIKAAINQSKLVGFDYYAPSGDSKRVIEPYLLVFQWSNWYLYGYCLASDDFRMFKLNRLWGIFTSEDTFTKRKYPELKFEISEIYENKIHLVAAFDASCKWRLIEEYGIDSFTDQPDGQLLFEFDFANKENLMIWILGFGDKVKIIEPSTIIDEYLKVIHHIKKKY